MPPRLAEEASGAETVEGMREKGSRGRYTRRGSMVYYKTSSSTTITTLDRRRRASRVRDVGVEAPTVWP